MICKIKRRVSWGSHLELLDIASPLFSLCPLFLCLLLWVQRVWDGGFDEDGNGNLHHNGALVIGHFLKDNSQGLLHAQPSGALRQDVLALCLALCTLESQSNTELHHVGQETNAGILAFVH
jgi:hypothetical protein